MPHIIIEYTETARSQIEGADVRQHVHQAVVASELFNPDAVKTRYLAYDSIAHGETGEHTDFVHVNLKILSGRPETERKKLATSVFAVLEKHLGAIPKRSVEIHEMDQATYIKN